MLRFVLLAALLAAVHAQQWVSCPVRGTGRIPSGVTQVTCANYSVPLDYTKPTGAQITVAVQRIWATKSIREGAVWILPGRGGATHGGAPALRICEAVSR